jgi:putative Mg2+ transporter-C (MgtC) family protein
VGQQTLATLHTFAALAVAFLLATIIGFERQWRQRTAGLRTTVLVAVGAAAFSDLGLRLSGNDGACALSLMSFRGSGFSAPA